ncbi:hypothetical protein [Streptomyces sp. NPDC056255]|uniref:hypothetical protein n=1 Tax=Streptomyces sp. NPDC056255 TaxID=3345764 RepID=UPI0035D80CF4
MPASAARLPGGSWRKARGSSSPTLTPSEAEPATEFDAARVDALPCDVTNETQVALFDFAVERHGRLDIVVNGRYGLQTMCEGGGQANVTIIERL